MRLLYFAWVRDAIGVGEETVELAAGVVTVADLVDWLVTRGAGYAPAFADRTRLRVAVDLEMAGFDADISAAHEVAFFPPVTGG